MNEIRSIGQLRRWLAAQRSAADHRESGKVDMEHKSKLTCPKFGRNLIARTPLVIGGSGGLPESQRCPICNETLPAYLPGTKIELDAE
jgi:hypothetical protein